MSASHATGQPWYREPWPWILMAGPVAVIIAGVITTWIAFATFDGLVAEDYYKQGLGVNRLLEREASAARLGVVARVELPADRHRITITLSGAAPAELRVRFVHATRPGHDLTLRLAPLGAGRYEAAVAQSFPLGRWRVQIEDSAAEWRLAYDWSGKDSAFFLGRDAGPGRQSD